MVFYQYFKSIVDQDTSAIVICDIHHKIIYMNPAACTRYEKYGGSALLGKSLLDCHNEISAGLIQKTIQWFETNRINNKIHTFYSEKENKDVYIIALRDERGELIGYYEKHEYRTRDSEPFYKF